MLLGNFEEAWRISDWLSSLNCRDKTSLWNGKSLLGSHLIIRCLHGYGDAIQFIRYAELARGLAKRVVIEVPRRLIPIVRSVRGIDEVISWEHSDGPEPFWDQQIEIMELPRAFRTRQCDIPCDLPYLAVDPILLSRAKQHVPRNDKLNIGLAWAAGDWNPSRSLPPQALAALLKADGCTFYSLQGGTAADEIGQFLPAKAIRHGLGENEGLDSALALIANMDLVISVDTVIAHLAGAIGKPVWTLLRFDADWRWMTNRSDSPWYPSMRLFRQSVHEDWRSVIQAVFDSLEKERDRICPAA